MPQLILSADPGFIHLALEEFRRDSRNGQALDELASGVFLLDCDEGFWGLAETWIDDPPVFTRHICPVDLTLSPLLQRPETSPASAMPSWPSTLTCLTLKSASQSRAAFSSICPYKPFDVNRAVCRLPLQRRKLAVWTFVSRFRSSRSSAQPLTGRQDQKSQLPQTNGNWPLLDFHLPPTTSRTGPAACAVSAAKRSEISRAEFKMLEAFEAFHIDLPAGGVALDLGAAPGRMDPRPTPKRAVRYRRRPRRNASPPRRRPRRAPQAHDR